MEADFVEQYLARGADAVEPDAEPWTKHVDSSQNPPSQPRDSLAQYFFL
ncbi:MAG: hypothetical protein HYV60_11440 [Planctomycetia bacterium]|nr:hypothetical protein [Planctomycetia bacterium]